MNMKIRDNDQGKRQFSNKVIFFFLNFPYEHLRCFHWDAYPYKQKNREINTDLRILIYLTIYHISISIFQSNAFLTISFHLLTGGMSTRECFCEHENKR